MNDDTTGTSRHVSQWIAAEARVVYQFASNPENLPRWAAGLADPALGAVTVEFVQANEFGVLDHVVELPSGDRFYNPMRVIPAALGEPRSEVVFTVRRLAGVTDEAFEADAAAVAADLATLRDLVEKAR
jgi:hypothetical protein